MNPRNSAQLYEKLTQKAKLILKNGVPASHESLFSPTQTSQHYYKTLYLDQIEPKRLGRDAKKRPGDENCKRCESFHLNVPKIIDKTSDIEVGKRLENCFEQFFNEELQKRGSVLICERADTENLHMPDFKIKDQKGNNIFYMEFKVIFRPYLKIASMLNRPDYECYSHSQTLDISNGKKLASQRELVQTIDLNKVVYVYWHDLPCVKGVFWMPAKRVYELWDQEATPYQRRVVAGDLGKSGEIRAAIHKIYLPLLEMEDFYSLFIVCSQK